ncbi:MAG: DNA-processing protein DprA [Paracoccaceae bacterium]
MSLTDLAPPLVPSETPAPARLSERERTARLRLARSENVGPRTFRHLIRRFGSALRAVDALPELAARGGAAAYRAASVEAVDAERALAEAAGARLLVFGDAEFPRALAEIDTPPPVLWIKGQAGILARPAIAIVGARNASAVGLRTARALADGLGAAGRVVVSGLARGIDAAAHGASLETGTVAVLAGGLDRIYPPENEGLAARISEAGVLVSETPMGVEAMARHFPKRNRIIAGLSAGVVLVEAAPRSGSLITARYALEQGREVMACPGSAEDPRSAGCNALIRDGAALVRNAEDVLEALSAPRGLPGLAEEGTEFLFEPESFEDGDDLDALADFELEGREDDVALAEQVLRLLGPTPVEIDELARACGATAAELSLVLLELDLAGRIDLLPGGHVAAAPAA